MQSKGGWLTGWRLAVVGISVGVVGGLLLLALPSYASATYGVCGMVRTNCVVDGDTVWIDGDKIRIADIDTPEIGEPRCEAELALGLRARDRLVDLMNAAPFEVRTIGNRDEDRYGRKLRVLVSGGRSLGDVLVSEGLARTWTGRREPWC